MQLVPSRTMPLLVEGVLGCFDYLEGFNTTLFHGCYMQGIIQEQEYEYYQCRAHRYCRTW